MIIVMKHGASAADIDVVVKQVEVYGYKAHLSQGTERTIIGVVGDDRPVQSHNFEMLTGVEQVVRILKPFKLASRDFHPEDTLVEVRGVPIGGPKLTIIAGPCSVENRSQLLETAHAVKEAGADILRGGAYKPRTSPYSFSGLGLAGLKLLAKARQEFGLKIVTEATGLHRHLREDGSLEELNVLEQVLAYADIVQVGARNMKSYGFLQELARMTRAAKTPILLKRGESSTLKDFLLAAEYIVINGNPNVMLCLRGIRAFEDPEFLRYTPDIGAVAVLKRECNLPVLFDPSHATGYRESVPAVGLAALAAGADGLLIETHHDPAGARCDGEQSITADQLVELQRNAARLRHCGLTARP